jgi:hypothetical protein
MTEKKVAANARNRKLSRGPVTEEGIERIRAAHLRHGFYLQAEEVAMRALGEDPAHYQELVQGLWQEYNPAGPSQEGLVIRLARATWLANRADRMQEGCAVRQAHEASSGRSDRVHARIMRLKMTEERVWRLSQRVADEHFVTTPEDLEKMKSLHQEGVLKDMGEIALALFYELRPPGAGEDGLDPQESARLVVAQVQEIFGIGTRNNGPFNPHVAPNFGQPEGSQQPPRPPAEKRDAQYPSITVAEWEARQRPRQLLENILRRQVESCEAQRKAAREELRKGPSPYERAAEIAPTHPNARLMRRMQDSNFREVRRVTNMLLKLKRHELKVKALEPNDDNDGSAANTMPSDEFPSPNGGVNPPSHHQDSRDVLEK